MQGYVIFSNSFLSPWTWNRNWRVDYEGTDGISGRIQKSGFWQFWEKQSASTEKIRDWDKCKIGSW